MTVRIAILGNSFAKLVQLPALAWANANGAPNEVVALAGYDGDKARATAAEHGIPFGTGDWQEALDPARVGVLDLVIVSTPVDLHAPMVRAVIERTGAAILCEKPFALDGDEARELRAAAAGRLALLDHQTRWSPWRRAFAREVSEGRVGSPWRARIDMRVSALARVDRPYSWWYDAERGGGVLGALGSHMIDGVLHQFGARIRSVAANLMTHVPERLDGDGEPLEVTADETALLWCELEGGLPVQFETSILDFGAARETGRGSLVELAGSEGVLRLEGETELVFVPLGGEPQAVPLEGEELLAPEVLGVGGLGFFARCLPYFLRDVVRAVARGEHELAGAATFDDAVHVMDVLDAARRASAEGCRTAVRDVD